MSRVLVLQHQDDAPPGLLAPWAQGRGLALDVLRPDRGMSPPSGDAVAAVVLGSDASVARRSAPWIAREVAWLRDLAADGVPVLGICFGAQALAAALGGDVRRSPTGPEIGWLRLDDPAPPVPEGPWFSWHEDVIEPPPRSAVLARSPTGVQAWSSGPHLGVQFHPEVTPAIVEGWASAYGGRDLADAGLDVERLRAQGAEHGEAGAAAARELFDAWAERAGL